MKVNVFTSNTNWKMNIRFKDFSTGDLLMSGTIEELERENNKAYKRLKERHIKDFYIEYGNLILWV